MTCFLFGGTCAAWVLRGSTGLVLGAALLGGCSDDGTLLQSGGSSADDGAQGTTGTITTTVTVTAASDSADPTADPTTDPTADTAVDSDGDSAGEGTAAQDGSSDGATTAAEDGGGSTGTGTDTEGFTEGTTCQSADDCVLVDNCCECRGAHAQDDVAACDEPCAQTECSAAGLIDPAVECRFGTCQLAEVSCNAALVSCKTAPPVCDEGMLPSVSDECYTNACVPAEACDYVPDCGWCDDGETCVQQVTQIGLWYRCEPVDPGCSQDVPTCACMGDQVCQAPYVCGEAMGELSCYCPVC